LREQVITQRVGERAGLYGKRASGAVAQKPAKRGARGDSSVGFIERLRSFGRYLPLVGKLAFLALAAGLIFAGYRAAASASFFQVRQVDVRGASRASADQIQQAVKHTVGDSGVWRADLSAVSKQIERLPWVRTAVVSRLLPDGLRVRITERVPKAVVRTAAGHFVWVDEDAVILSDMLPGDQMPAFFLRGWGEENSDETRRDNRDRVQKYLEISRDWTAAGLADRVSEVNLIDVADVRAQLAGEDSQIEVRLGAKDLGTRLKKALEVLDEQRHTPRGPFITCVDLSQGKRAIVRFTSGTQLGGEPVASESGRNAETNPVASEPSAGSASSPARHPASRESRENPATRNSEARNRGRRH
jgi:cell division protein FtsQ